MYSLAIYEEGNALLVSFLRLKKGKSSVILLRAFEKKKIGGKLLSTLAPVLKRKKYETATALKTEEILFRTLSFPFSNKKSIQKALPFQLEEVLPYPAENSVIFPLFGKRDSSLLPFFAVQKRDIEEHIEEMMSIGIDPDAISSVPHALAQFGAHFWKESPLIIIYHQGKVGGTLCLVKEGNLSSFQLVGIGVKHLIDALEEDSPNHSEKELHALAKNINLASIDPELFPHLKKKTVHLQGQIERALSALEKQCGNLSSASIGCTGMIISSPYQLDPFFKEMFGEKFSYLEMPKIKEYKKETLIQYPIPIGLCLEKLSPLHNSIEIRQGVFATKKAKRQKKYLIAASCVAIGTILSTLFATKYFLLEREKKQIWEQVNGIASDNPIDFDTSIKGIKEALSYYEKQLRVASEYTPLVPMPNVTEVLNEISKYNMSGTLENFDYKVARYPKLGNKKEPYEVEVRATLHFPSENAAVQFHDAFVKNSSLIKSEKELSYTIDTTAYSIFFTLKEKTL